MGKLPHLPTTCRLNTRSARYRPFSVGIIASTASR
jgi:hypothetical protein